jgi:CubicO group peptidase (beta-lactamase class C family)/leucyl aminopeptidase (aminopeptidase T)
MTEAIRRQDYPNIHAVLIERNGRLVYEEYFEGENHGFRHPANPGPSQPPVRIVFNHEMRHDLRSVSKSVVSALAGIALESGAIHSLDQPLLDFFPEHADLATSERRAITLRHALTMSAGLRWREWGVPYTDESNDHVAMLRSADAARYVLDRPIAAEPGLSWEYNSGLTHLVAEVVQRSTGRPLLDYAHEVLFEPLQIIDVEWVADPAGMPAAGSGLRMRPRDLAKFGSLYLHGGRWDDRQVIPEAWICESTQRRIAVTDSIWEFGETGYGYQWWHDHFTTGRGPLESFTAVGNGGQNIFVLPALDMVVTMLAGRYNVRGAPSNEQLLLEWILPAVRDLFTAGEPAVDLGAVAETVARRTVRVQPGELIWITGGSEDVPFMEHLAVAVGAEGGHPVVTVSSDEMLRRWYREVPERFDARREEWLWRLHDLADVIIQLQSTDYSIYAEIPPERLAAWDAANAGLLDVARRRGSRVVRIGNGLFPSDWRARMLGVDRADLERAFWAGLLADPAELAASGERLREVLHGASTIRVQHPNGTDLTVGIGPGRIIVTDGTTAPVSHPPDEADPLNITWLPGGEVTLALDPERADGRLVVERFFFDGQTIGPFTLTYSQGRMQTLESDGDLSVLLALLDPAVPLSDRLTGLKFGVNPHVTDERLLPWMGAGVFSLSMGSNVLLGGDLELPFYFFFTLPGATVHVDERIVVADGQLLAADP